MEKIPHYGNIWSFLKYVVLNTFQRLTRKGLKMTSDKNIINMKVVDTFKPYSLESRNVQNRVQMRQICPNLRRVQKQFRDSESR
jgi:hypothetical protein